MKGTTTIVPGPTSSVLPSDAIEPVLNAYIHALFGRSTRDQDEHGQTPLMEAIVNSDEASVFMLLKYHSMHRNMDHDEDDDEDEEGINNIANLKDIDDQTALHLAATRGKPFCIGEDPKDQHLRQSTIVESFFPEPRNLPPVEGDGCSSRSSERLRPRRSSRGSYESIVDLLLEHSADYEAREKNNLTPLHIAVYCGAQLIVRRLLEVGANVNCKGGPMEYAPLHVSIEKNNESMVELLLEMGGADIHSKCKGDLTTLHVAVGNGLENMVKILLKHGADCCARDKADETALHHATHRSTASIAQLLLDHGADIHARDSTGSTPLHHAVWKGSRSCVDMLLTQGADVNMGNNQGDTALHWAAWFNDIPMGEQLLAGGALINATNIEGLTPLQRTRDLKGVDSFVRMLIKHGADIHAKDRRRRTPLLFAVEDGCEPTVRVLLEAGANVHDIDVHGCTTLHYAAKGGHCRIAGMLLRNGADLSIRRRLDRQTALDLVVGSEWETDFSKVVQEFQNEQAIATASSSSSTIRAATDDLSPTSLSKKQRV